MRNAIMSLLLAACLALGALLASQGGPKATPHPFIAHDTSVLVGAQHAPECAPTFVRSDDVRSRFAGSVTYTGEALEALRVRINAVAGRDVLEGDTDEVIVVPTPFGFFIVVEAHGGCHTTGWTVKDQFRPIFLG